MNRTALRDTELVKTIQYFWDPQPVWMMTRGFLPDWPWSEIESSESAFFTFLDLGYEGDELIDLFICF